MSRYRKVMARIPDKKKLCEICKGNGSIIVRRAVCTEPLESIQICQIMAFLEAALNFYRGPAPWASAYCPPTSWQLEIGRAGLAHKYPKPDTAATRKAARAAAIPALSIFWAFGASPLSMLASAARKRRSATATAARYALPSGAR